MRKSTAILAVLSCVWMTPVQSASSDEVLDIVRAVAATGHPVPLVKTLREACDADTLCVAKFLKDRLGDGAQIIPFDESTSKTNRWRTATPALHRVIEDARGRLIIVPERYDAEAIADAVEAAESPVHKIVIDLREIDSDGDLDGMRRVAALFIGKVDRAFQVRHSAGKVVDWTITKPSRQVPLEALEVWVNDLTDATGEVFAALMRSHAKALVLGQATHARGYVQNIIPFTPGWALAAPAARIFVKDVDLDAGVIPDGPLPD